jgi:hypothetical protein
VNEPYGCRVYAMFDYPTVTTLIMSEGYVLRKAVDALNGKLLSSLPQPELVEYLRLFGEEKTHELIESLGFKEVMVPVGVKKTI